MTTLLPIYERTVDATRAALGEEAFATACAEGRAMTEDQAVAYALNEDKPLSYGGLIGRYRTASLTI